MSTQPVTAAEATRIARKRWTQQGASIGMHFDVPDCPFSDKEIESLSGQGRSVAYLPPALAGARDRPALARIFPKMASYTFLPDNVFPNDVDHSGWFDYDDAIDAPHLGTSQAELEAALHDEHRRLLTLNEYAVASQDLHERTGHYLDERATWARIGTRLDSRLIAVRFDGAEMAIGLGQEEPADGSLLIAYDLAPGDRPRVLGARTSTMRATPNPGTARHADTVSPEHILRPPTAPTPEALAATLAGMASTFLSYGFHRELDLSVEEYLATLPKQLQQPESYRGRMDVPVLVETRIPWRRQVVLAGVRLSHGTRTSEALPERPDAAVERDPYVAWCTDWGQHFSAPIAPGLAREELAADELGASIEELLSMEFARPDLSRAGRFFEAIGNVMHDLIDPVPVVSSETVRFPCLYFWRGQPELGVNLNPDAYSIFRPLTRGIVTNH